MKLKLFLIAIIILPSCSKRKNIPLAKNYYEQSIVEAQENDFKKAIQLVNKSIEISPSAQALALKAMLLYQNKEYSESLIILKKLIHDKNITDSFRADMMNNYACSLLALNKLNEAQKIWVELTNDRNYISPEVAWFNLGLFEFNNQEKNNENYFRAVNYFNKAIEIESEYVDSLFYLALTHLKLNQKTEAKERLIALISIEPRHEMAQKILESITNENNI